MLRVLGVVAFVAAGAVVNEVARPADAALLAGSSKLEVDTTAEEQAQAEELKTLEREEDNGRQSISRLQDRLETVEEKKAEEEGELEVSQAEEEELQKPENPDDSAGPTPTFLQISEDSQEESDARELHRLTNELAAAEASLDEARSTAKLSQERLQEQTEDLRDVRGLVQKVQKFDDSLSDAAKEKEAVLADTHKMLTNPLAAEATSLGLPTPAPILAQLASQDVSVRNRKASLLENRLKSAEEAVDAQKAEVEHQKKQLELAQANLQKAEKTDPLTEVSKLKKHRAVLLQKLQTTSRVDKAAFQTATAETKRLQEVMASKEKELQTDKSAAVSEKAASEAAAVELKQQEAKTSQVQSEVETKTKELQAAKDQLNVSKKALAQINQTMSDSMELQQESGEDTSSLQQSGLQRTLERVQEQTKQLKQQMEQIKKLNSEVEAALETEQNHTAAKDMEEQVIEEHVHREEKVNETKKQVVMLEEQAVQARESLSSSFAAKRSQAEAQQQAALTATKERVEAELDAQRSALEEKKTALEESLYHEKNRAAEEAEETSKQMAMLQTNLTRVKDEQEQSSRSDMANAAQVEAQLLQQRMDMQSQIQASQQKVLAEQNASLLLEEDIRLKKRAIAEVAKAVEDDAKKLKSMEAEETQKVESVHDKLAEVEREAALDLKSDEGKHVEEVKALKEKLSQEDVEAQTKEQEVTLEVSRAKQSYAALSQEAAKKTKDLAPLAKEVKSKHAELSKVRGFLAREQELSSAAQEKLTSLEDMFNDA